MTSTCLSFMLKLTFIIFRKTYESLSFMDHIFKIYSKESIQNFFKKKAKIFNFRIIKVINGKKILNNPKYFPSFYEIQISFAVRPDCSPLWKNKERKRTSTFLRGVSHESRGGKKRKKEKKKRKKRGRARSLRQNASTRSFP